MKRLWTPEELAEEWTLHSDELAILANKTGHTRLGFGILLRFFAREGRFPESRQEVPHGSHSIRHYIHLPTPSIPAALLGM